MYKTRTKRLLSWERRMRKIKKKGGEGEEINTSKAQVPKVKKKE